MSETFTIDAGDGTINIASRGARLLGLRVEGLEENLVYDDGKQAGGDRLWVAPEVAYYWPSLEDARRDPVGTGATPADVDPGTYEIDGEWDGGVHLVNTCSLVDSRDEKAIGLEMKRTFAVIGPPHGLPAGVKCVSFSITNELTVTGGDDGAVASAWDILQVPPTGTLICPTTQRVEPRSYYDPFGDRHVVIDDVAVRFLIDAGRRVKMGIRPEHTTGRMGYFRKHDDDQASLIVRVFPVSPGETYVDIPRDHPADQRRGGDALQAYNDDGTFGAFGEMEFVAPAVMVGGCEYRHTPCVTHALVGPDAAVKAAGRTLLGVDVEMIG
jgi:hypothetical protein